MWYNYRTRKTEAHKLPWKKTEFFKSEVLMVVNVKSVVFWHVLENEGSMSLQNTGNILLEYTVSYPRRLHLMM
jgi:hypothetical protein